MARETDGEGYMANLNQVGIVREEYRDLLRSKPGAGGPTLEEETVQGASKNYSEEVIVNVAISLEQLPFDGDGVDDEIERKKLILRDTVEFLDHLDTLGMEVRHKL